MLSVAIQGDDKLRALRERMLEAFPQTRGFAAVALVAQQSHRKASQPFGGTVGRAVVNDHDIGHDLQSRFSQFANCGGFVVSWNDDDSFGRRKTHLD